MKQRSEDYHVKINPRVMFDTHNKFESFYAPWVYVYLKLDYNNSIQNAPNSFYKIDTKPICDFFGVHRATISRAFTQLVENGLLEKRGREYKLLNDKDVYPYENNEEEGQLPEFVQVYNNFFIDFVELLNREFEELRNKPRSLMKVIQIFYYLITRNRHILLDSEILESKENDKSITKNLRHDNDNVKNYLNKLQEIGYIEIDERDMIHTIYTHGTVKPKKNFNKEIRIKKPIYVPEPFITEEPVYLPEPFIAEENDTEFDTAPVSKIKTTKPEREPVPITDRERIDYILMMYGGDGDKLKRLMDENNISTESLEEYLAA